MAKRKSGSALGAKEPVRRRAAAKARFVDADDSIWGQKGATLSDKSARQEFGLTQPEIIGAIRAGRLQFRVCSMHGNPWFRLLRQEVESLVQARSGQNHLHRKKLQKQLADLNRESRKITTRLKAIESQRAELMKELGE